MKKTMVVSKDKFEKCPTRTMFAIMEKMSEQGYSVTKSHVMTKANIKRFLIELRHSDYVMSSRQRYMMMEWFVAMFAKALYKTEVARGRFYDKIINSKKPKENQYEVSY